MNSNALPAIGANRDRSSVQWSVRFRTGWLIYACSLVPALLVFILGALFVRSSYGTQDDDGYIFYQYALNLSQGHGLSFNPGEISYGVTSGAWVALLAAFHWLLRADIVVEAQWLGLGLCALSAGLWALAVGRWTGRPLLGLFCASVYALELDAMKASLNGLETGLNLAVFAAVACLLARLRFERPAALGALFGLAMLTRPDNVVLLLPVLAVAIMNGLPFRSTIRKLAVFGATALASLAPWYGWLWLSTGSPIPPTQTGKLLVFLPMNLGITLGEFQALGVIGRLFFGLRVLFEFIGGGGPVRLAVLGWTGVAVLSIALWLGRSTRHFGVWPMLLASCLLIQALLYSWYFPLLKLRYLINLLPLGLVLALASLALLWIHYQPRDLMSNLMGRLPRSRLIKSVGAVLLAVVLLAGAFLYYREVNRQVSNYQYYVTVQDVRNQVGSWLRKNTPVDSLVALEPIGSVAFYSDRRILDLGGLTDQSIWPSLANGYADGKAMARLLIERKADYLVDYTNPAGIGGVSNALPAMPIVTKVVVIESAQATQGARNEYGSYTIYKLGTK